MDRSLDLAEGTVRMIASEGGEAAAHEADLTDEDQCRAMAEAALARFGRIDVLDNSIGIASLDTVVPETQVRWERVMRVNVEAMFLTSKHVIPAMIESGDGGAIVNISSVNNAGTTKFVAATDMDGLDAADFERIFTVNVLGAFQMTRAARTALEASGDGAIVNISSYSGMNGLGSSLAY